MNNILEDVESLVTSSAVEASNNKDGEFILMLQLILALLVSFKTTLNKFYNVLWFVSEQISLMIEKQYRYSAEFLVFSSIFYNMSPNAYRYLRESGNCLLPSYSTIRRITVGNSMSPLVEQTDTALSHTTKALLDIAEYCFSELDAKYVLLGKFQTDSLEARFGQYRQLAGGQYDVSLGQIYECEKKIRLLSVLKL